MAPTHKNADDDDGCEGLCDNPETGPTFCSMTDQGFVLEQCKG